MDTKLLEGEEMENLMPRLAKLKTDDNSSGNTLERFMPRLATGNPFPRLQNLR